MWRLINVLRLGQIPFRVMWMQSLDGRSTLWLVQTHDTQFRKRVRWRYASPLLIVATMLTPYGFDTTGVLVLEILFLSYEYLIPWAGLHSKEIWSLILLDTTIIVMKSPFWWFYYLQPVCTCLQVGSISSSIGTICVELRRKYRVDNCNSYIRFYCLSAILSMKFVK